MKPLGVEPAPPKMVSDYMAKLKAKVNDAKSIVKSDHKDLKEVHKQPPPALLAHDVSRTGVMTFGFSEEMTIPGFLKNNKRELSITMNQLDVTKDVLNINFVLKLILSIFYLNNLSLYKISKD